MKIYAGIGSRRLPSQFFSRLIRDISVELDGRGFTLSTGGARGSDQSFMAGASRPVQLWLPYDGFEGYTSSNQIHPDAYEMAERFHLYWGGLDTFGQRAHARNCHIALGADLQTPVKFVIAYTQDGRVTGGTATALRIARANQIPIFNIGSPSESMESLVKFIDTNA